MAKKISASVGVGGANRPTDVFTIQYRLNHVPNNRGGPAPKLAVDAICGPLTKGAIQKFQKASGAPTDGRVDPGGPTFRNLLAYDPYPNRDLTAAIAGASYLSATLAKAITDSAMKIAGEAAKAGKNVQAGFPSPSGPIGDLSGKIAGAIKQATDAAAKLVEVAAKSVGKV